MGDCQHGNVSRNITTNRDEKDVWDDVAKQWKHICMETTTEKRVCNDCGAELSSSSQTRGC